MTFAGQYSFSVELVKEEVLVVVYISMNEVCEYAIILFFNVLSQTYISLNTINIGLCIH
jgi:GTP cyclohydrolase I